MIGEKCTEVGPDCPADGSSLGYPPNLVINIIFMGVFGTSLVCHLVQGWRAKTWTFMAAMCLGSNSEVIGYLGRVLMHSNPYRLSTFLVQIIFLTQGPAFYAAGLYLCLSRLVIVYGEDLSRIKPINYTRFFMTCDAISLSLQGAGGGVAASATTMSSMTLGNRLMLVGLIFQIVVLAIFAICCADFAFRVHKFPSRKNQAFQKLRSSARFRGFLVAVVVCFTTISIRCIYRVIELGGGWNNSLMRKEVPFIFLESGMITIAVYCFILFHPGSSFPDNTFNIRSYKKITDDNSKEAISLISAPHQPNQDAWPAGSRHYGPGAGESAYYDPSGVTTEYSSGRQQV